jgi:hypothetical protein
MWSLKDKRIENGNYLTLSTKKSTEGGREAEHQNCNIVLA